MRTVTIYCDRCKIAFKPQPKEIDNRNLKLMNYEEDQYDICPECYKDLERWFDKGQVMGVGNNERKTES